MGETLGVRGRVLDEDGRPLALLNDAAVSAVHDAAVSAITIV
jgi:protocatechuate 3,4-dioxygenase beta subunit